MKIIIISLFFFYSITGNDLFAQNKINYKISLFVKDTSGVKKIFLSYMYGGNEITDSFMITKKLSVLSKKIAQPLQANLYTDNKKVTAKAIFLAGGNLFVHIKGDMITVNKSTVQDMFENLTVNDRVRPTYFPLYGELTANNDTAGLNKIGAIFDSLKKDDIKKAYQYFKKNTGSPLALFAFNRYSTFAPDYALIENDFLKLPYWLRNSPDGKIISAKIAAVKMTGINKPAVNFSQLSNKGKIIRLKAYKGKYVLLNFWASWCVPCRKEHPDFIELYKKYQSKNFEIISVSLDNDKAAWLDAIDKDGINWINVADLKGQQNTIAIKYGVQAIPANFLIDPAGIIIAKDLTNEQLIEKLSNLF